MLSVSLKQMAFVVDTDDAEGNRNEDGNETPGISLVPCFCSFLICELRSARYMPWPFVRVSVSVSSRTSIKTAKHRMMQTVPHDSPGTLLF